MNKRTATRWYIGAWVVWLVALSLAVLMRSSVQGRVSAGLFLLGMVIVAAGAVMVITWIGALIKLGTQSKWGWFVGVLVLGLIGLGIVGMVAYSLAGPADVIDVAIRPTTT